MNSELPPIIQENILLYLNEEERSQISSPVAEKLNKEWLSKLEIISELQANNERSNTNAEQQRFQLEKQLLEIQKKLEEEGHIKAETKKQLETLEEKVNLQNAELQKANDRINSQIRQLENFRVEQDETSTQRTAMAASLESKIKLVAELRGQLNTLEEHLSSIQKSKCEAMIQAEEASALQIQLQFKERRFEQEKVLLQTQVELLQKQLEERSEEVLTIRREHSTTVLTLQSELSHASEELKVLKGEKESFQTDVADKNKRIEELLASLNERRISVSRLEETFRQELSAQKKISAIYKASSEEQTKKCGELDQACEELRQLLQEASEQYGALEKAKAKSEEDAQASLDQSSLLIKDLREELEKVNELLQSQMKKDDILAEMSPAASAASQLMSKGMTLTQLYTEFLSTSERLFQAKEENKRLTRYVEQILQEFEERAPIMKKQKEDYQRSLETISVLNAQIEDYIEDLEKQRLEAEEAVRRAGFLGRENDRLSQQVKDLSKQVTILLTQVEAARAGLPPPPLFVLDCLSPPDANASAIIDQRLVTFRDVSELQQQNQKLLVSLRDITEKMESSEKDAVESKTKNLSNDLQQAQKELAEIRSSREKMKSVVENVTRQRDTYRTILNQQQHQEDCNQSFSSVNLKELEKSKQELLATRKELARLKKDEEEYRQERQKNDQLEKNELEKMKASLEITRNENIRLLSHAEYNEERLKTLQNNCEAYQRQVNGLVEKSNTLQGIIGKHEGTIETLRDTLLTQTKKLSQAEVVAVNCRKERDLLKESEARLVAERESLHHNQYSQSMILSNLEAIKNNLERNDSETKMRYENQITDLTEQCSHLKAKIENNVDIKEANLKVSSLEERLQLSKAETDAVKNSLHGTEVQLENISRQLQDLRQERMITTPTSPICGKPRMGSSPSFGMPLNASSPQFGRGPRSSPGLNQSLRELQVELSEEKAKSSSLKAASDVAQRSLTDLKKLVEEQELQIKNSTETNKAAEAEIVNLRASLEDAEKKIGQLTEKVKTGEENEKALRETMNDQLLKMTEDLEERENELEEAQKRFAEAKEAEDLCRLQMTEQSKLAKDMQDKYEWEVMHHGADLKALVALKEKLTALSSQTDALTVSKLKAEEALRDIESGYKEREDKLKGTIEAAKAREAELQEQNKALLDQFTLLSEKMTKIQNKLSSGDGGNVSFQEDEARSSDQLREVIKYLRRERELSDGKAEAAHAEAERLKAQKNALEYTVNLLNKHLADEREKNQSSLESAGKYEEIMRKVNTLDALADSNRLLREEKCSLENNLAATKASLNSLQDQIKPLQQKAREQEGKLQNLTEEKKSLENEKELLKKRTQELVEKLNKSKPEEILRLQQELATVQKSFKAQEIEVNRLKTLTTHLQKNQQNITAHKNQVAQQLTNEREETKKLTDENKKLSEEKFKLHQQVVGSTEKVQSLEKTLQQSQEQHLQLKNQLVHQTVELRQKEEVTKRENETLKQTLETKEAALKEGENAIKEQEEKYIILEKKNLQLRKIATKYKKQAETTPDVSEGGAPIEEDMPPTPDKVKELEEKIASLLQQLDDAPKKEEVDKLRENLSRLETELKRKHETTAKLNLPKDATTSKADLEMKLLEYQKLSATQIQFREAITSQVVDLSKKLNETQAGRSLMENKILSLEKERDQYMQQVEGLNKKLQIQQKQLENLQKSTGVSKAPAGGISIEKISSEPPPTANIKPMAAPAPTVSSPRSQGVSSGGTSRSIPTASIRPLAPSSGQTSSSIGIVQPMESHSSGDGAVSSTVTLPQATVTPTPVALASTSQAFSSTLTATVSPTTVSASSVASISPFPQPLVTITSVRAEELNEVPQMPSGSADAIISQAIAMVIPQGDDRGTQKRKLNTIAEEGDEDDSEAAKKSRIIEEALAMIGEDDQDMDEEDAGEPSSSFIQKDDDGEVLVVSSDDELVPSSQSEMAGDRDLPQHDEESQGGEREAEAEHSEGETASSTQQMISHPVHEPPTSSSHQTLAPFHQLPSYEGGADDRTVPSTPTLFISRPGEGPSGDGVSSLQVPSQGFEFGSSRPGSSEASMITYDGLSQITEGGTIDVTRVDLGQLEHDASLRPPPSRRIPTVEVSAEGNISSSAGEQVEVTQSPSPSETASEADSGIQEPLRARESSAQEAMLRGTMEDQNQVERGEVGSSQGQHLSDPEDDEDDEENHSKEVPVDEPMRATMSTTYHTSEPREFPELRRITPITWSVSPRPSRLPYRGGYQGGRDMQMPPQSHRYGMGGRGQMSSRHRARRSRPGGPYSRGPR